MKPRNWIVKWHSRCISVGKRLNMRLFIRQLDDRFQPSALPWITRLRVEETGFSLAIRMIRRLLWFATFSESSPKLLLEMCSSSSFDGEHWRSFTKVVTMRSGARWFNESISIHCDPWNSSAPKKTAVRDSLLLSASPSIGAGNEQRSMPAACYYYCPVTGEPLKHGHLECWHLHFQRVCHAAWMRRHGKLNIY